MRGFTKRHPQVPEPMRGTFARSGAAGGAGASANLGVTAVELLPIHAFVDDDYLVEKGLTTIGATTRSVSLLRRRRYLRASRFRFDEFKEMVALLHDAGIEVILDVVYNHTAEGNELGPTLSFKGIDNTSYYRLCRTASATTSTIPGPGTPSISPIRASCRW